MVVMNKTSKEILTWYTIERDLRKHEPRKFNKENERMRIGEGSHESRKFNKENERMRIWEGSP